MSQERSMCGQPRPACAPPPEGASSRGRSSREATGRAGAQQGHVQLYSSVQLPAPACCPTFVSSHTSAAHSGCSSQKLSRRSSLRDKAWVWARTCGTGGGQQS